MYHEIEISEKSQNLYYLFFNTGSGSVRAKQLLNLDCQALELTIGSKQVKIKFYSIMNIQSRKAGYQTLREDLKFNQQISIVIGGGDGTMMWVVEQMLEFQIDINQIIIIPMPFGTGNDFSNALGWGKSVPHDIIGYNYQTLKYFIYQWEKGYVCFFDVWDIIFKTTKDGYMLEINRTNQGYNKQVVKDRDGLNTQLFTKKMANYLSVGVDARIGYGFDKHRTQSKHINKICYCLEGLKKMFLRTKKINEVIQDLQYDNEGQLKQLFKTSNIYEINDGNVIPGNPANLLCLNINSYSAGVQDIWKNAKRNQYISTYSEGTSFSDGLLEFLSFNSITGMGCERLISGNAQRIAQSKGPLLLKFREEPNINLETYFQVDGQFFNVINPQSLEIRPCSQLPNGKIRVLRCQK